MRFATCIMFLVSIQSCQKSDFNSTSHLNHSIENSPMIVGGRDVSSNHQLASHVAIISKTDETGQTQICTGVFISKNLIATAKHCLTDNNDDISVTFRTGSYDQTTDVVDLPIQQVFEMKNETNVKRDDLVIIQIMTPNDFPAEPVQIYQNQKILNSQIILLGYGVNSADGSGLGQLRSKNISADEFDFSQNTFEINQKLNHGGVCFGDSGGPALAYDEFSQKYFLVGIASAVIGSACANQSIFMNILFYKNQIQELL